MCCSNCMIVMEDLPVIRSNQCQCNVCIVRMVNYLYNLLNSYCIYAHFKMVLRCSVKEL